MLSQLIRQNPANDQQAAVITTAGSTSWGQVRGLAQGLAQEFRPFRKRRIGLVLRPGPYAIASLAALDELACDTFLFGAHTDPNALNRLARQLELGAILACPAQKSTAVDVTRLIREAKATGQSTVTILTSGSSGTPKAVRHSWGSLARPVRLTPTKPPPRWLLGYRPELYAGLQVLMQCLANGGALIVPPAEANAEAIAELMRSGSVSHASATASYWRRLLMFAQQPTLRGVPLCQITIGGEVVDQQLLDALHETFPAALITHIYATTELGRCFAVRDKLAGFPVDLLNSVSRDGIEIQVDDGELVVRSANAMVSYDRRDGETEEPPTWFHTGDLVSIRGNRVYFEGRASDVINVGGNKVHPIEVERVIRAVAGVADVRVFGRRSSIAGELVSCEVVAAQGHDVATVQAAIRTSCSARLDSFKHPRLIHFVTSLAMGSAFKTIRRTSS